MFTRTCAYVCTCVRALPAGTAGSPPNFRMKSSSLHGTSRKEAPHLLRLDVKRALQRWSLYPFLPRHETSVQTQRCHKRCRAHRTPIL
jgi:hypothetical protein